MKKLAIVASIMSLLISSYSFALTPKEQKGVKVLTSPSLVYEAPSWVQPTSLDKASEDVNDWKDVLPYEEDHDADMYVVLPTIGVISPVIFVPEGTKDYKNMASGKQIDINKYLDRGVMHYPKTGLPGEVANPVIFGHSNFFKNGEGDYKTIFADIMNLDVSAKDEMWIFEKNEDGEYDLEKFEITASYETVPTDVEVMIPQGGKELTVFACTNGLAGRWILKGKYIESDEVLIPYIMKREYADLLEQLAEKPQKRQQEIVSTMLNKIEEVQNGIASTDASYHAKFKKYVLAYIEKELVISVQE